MARFADDLTMQGRFYNSVTLSRYESYQQVFQLVRVTSLSRPRFASLVRGQSANRGLGIRASKAPNAEILVDGRNSLNTLFVLSPTRNTLRMHVRGEIKITYALVRLGAWRVRFPQTTNLGP